MISTCLERNKKVSAQLLRKVLNIITDRLNVQVVSAYYLKLFQNTWEKTQKNKPKPSHSSHMGRIRVIIKKCYEIILNVSLAYFSLLDLYIELNNIFHKVNVFLVN